MKYIMFFGLIGLIMQITTSPQISMQDKLVIEAYTYGFPLVLMDATKNQISTAVNQFVSIRTFPDANMKDVVSPNADILYSQAWLDLGHEPVVFNIPDMGNRYYLYPLLDEWTNVFFSPGTRTTGQGKQTYFITGPHWKGEIPEGMKEIKAPTDRVWVIGRIQTNGFSDFAAVNKLQDQFTFTPSTVVSNAPKSLTEPPIQQVMQMEGGAFFKKLAELLKTVKVPPRDNEYIKKFSAIGLIPGKDFMTNIQVEQLNRSVERAKEQIVKDWKNPPSAKDENGWQVLIDNMGSYGAHYPLRASVAYGALGANLPEDAIYPKIASDDKGEPLSGSSKYNIHFDKGELPPVGAFWSITMYDDKHFFVPNPLNKYVIRDRDPLKFNPDGSLDLYIQNDSPGADKEANWLPAPDGLFNLILRLYEPDKAIINGSWLPPKVQKAS